MDRMRSCYETDMVFRVGDPPVRVRWYFAEPGAKQLPYRHHFASLNWERPVDDLSPGLGEDPTATRVWYNGANFVGATGVGNSIPASKWMDGLDAGECFSSAVCQPGFWELVRIGVADYLRMINELRTASMIDVGVSIVLELRNARELRGNLLFGPIMEGKLPPGVRLIPAINRIGMVPNIPFIRQRALRAVPKVGVVPVPGRLGRPMRKPVVPFGGRNDGRMMRPGRKVLVPQVGVVVPGEPMRPMMKAFAPPAGVVVPGDPLRPIGKQLAPVVGLAVPGKVLVASRALVGCGCVGLDVPLSALRRYAFSGTGTAGTVAAAVEQLERFALVAVGTKGLVSAAVEQLERFAFSGTGTAGTVAAAVEQLERFAFSGTGTAGTVAAAYTDTSVTVDSFTMTGTGTTGSVTAVYRNFATTTTCSVHSPMPVSWHFTVAGVANGTCSLCSHYNGTFTITQTGGCVWADSATGVCASPPIGSQKSWKLTHDGTLSQWVLDATNQAGSAIARYTLADASFNYSGDNVMSRSTNSGACGSWPSTITMIPGP